MPMKRTIFIISTMVVLMTLMLVVGIDAQTDKAAQSSANSSAKQEARRQRRAERLAEYEKYIDSLVTSHHFRFVPQTMQQLPAGMMRNLVNPNYEVTVNGGEVDVCIPFLKGYVPPFYPVVFNYVLPMVEGYTAEQTNDGWNVTFRTTLFSATDYTFSLEIYSHYGAMLTISSPFYNSVQYTGNIMAI